jgi:hypothetical protein
VRLHLAAFGLSRLEGGSIMFVVLKKKETPDKVD